MATLFITCMLHCCTRVLTPNSQWTDQDNKALQLAQQHCQQENKCLITFKKVEEGVYSAICGQENN